MKRFLCLIAGVAILAACEKKTETVAPTATGASPEASASTTPATTP
jgi:uncharacterized lipoprotein YajG